MKKMIVTGCNGQLGREINKLYGSREDIELINTDVEELDITDLEAVMALAKEHKPYAIINCAAYTNVDGCETNQDLAFRINVIGPRNLAIAAREVKAKLVHISTDYVFSGDKEGCYYESDPIAPKTVYGETKAEAERMVERFADRYYIFRTAWLYGDGKNFVRTMLKLSESHDTLRVVNDQFGTPTSTLELARAIDSLLFTDNYGTYHATCEGSCNWAEFAEEIFRLAGKNVKVEYVTSEEYGAPANRPKNSILENRMLKAVGGYTFCEWHEAIKTYLDSELK